MTDGISDDGSKLFYSIGEVSKMTGANETTLRFWEKEFKEIKPRRSSRGIRFYSNRDVKIVKLIYHLIKEKGMTLDGVRKRLKDNMSKDAATLDVVKRLMDVRSELMTIRNGIDLIESGKQQRVPKSPKEIIEPAVPEIKTIEDLECADNENIFENNIEDVNIETAENESKPKDDDKTVYSEAAESEDTFVVSSKSADNEDAFGDCSQTIGKDTKGNSDKKDPIPLSLF